MDENVPDQAVPAYFKARPTVYNGIKMRSRHEAGFAAWLDRVGFEWVYEPECIAHPTLGQYLPDFLLSDVLVLSQHRLMDVFIEVKPSPFMTPYQTAHDAAVRMQTIVNDAYPEAMFMLVVNRDDRDGGSSVDFAADFVPKDTRGTARLYQWVTISTGTVLIPRIRDMPLPWQGEWWKGDA